MCYVSIKFFVFFANNVVVREIDLHSHVIFSYFVFFSSIDDTSNHVFRQFFDVVAIFFVRYLTFNRIVNNHVIWFHLIRIFVASNDDNEIASNVVQFFRFSRTKIVKTSLNFATFNFKQITMIFVDRQHLRLNLYNCMYLSSIFEFVDLNIFLNLIDWITCDLNVFFAKNFRRFFLNINKSIMTIMFVRRILWFKICIS